MRLFKLICAVAAFAICFGVLAACNDTDTAPSTNDTLEQTDGNQDTEAPNEDNENSDNNGEDNKEGQTVPAEPLLDNCVSSTPKGKFYIYGETDKDALGYKVGEDMVFSFSICDSADAAARYRCPKFIWSASADDGQKWSGEADGKSGELRLSFKMKSEGFIKVEVYVETAAGKEYTAVKRFVGGACCGFENIKTAKAQPENFAQFWQTQLARLDGVAPELLYKNEITSTNNNFYTYDIAIRSHDGDAPVTAYLTVPKNAELGKTKVRMFFFGYNASFSSKPQYNNGYITLAVNAHSMENGRESAYYNALKNGELKNYGFSASGYTDPASAYFCDMILRDVQALRYLKTIPEWNGKDLELVGGSMGGFQATATAALEGGVSHLKVHIVWMCDVGGRDEGRLEGWLPEYTDNLRYFDTVYFASMVNCKTTISSAGLADYTATPCGVAAYYNALKCTKSVTFIQAADHGLSVIKRVTYSRSSN